MAFPSRSLAIAFLTLLIPTGLVAQSQATITQGSNLRADPSTHNPPIQTLAKGTHVTLLETKSTNGFYHVRTPEKKEGWVWTKNVTTGIQASQISRKVVRRPVIVEEVREQLGSAAACQPDLSSCPISGCSAPEVPHGLANQLKRRVPKSSTAVLLTFDDFQVLQQQADNLVGENKELTAGDRAKLAGLAVGNGQVSEGAVVSVVGYLVGVPHPNTGESVNCNLKGEQNNDFHIPISNDPDNTDFQGIVVEMIPQNRPDTWTLANLTQVENNRQLVMVTGALFYDNFHFVNGDPSSPKRGQPHRFSLWEAHPLTQFVVCTKPDNSCDPTQTGDWTPLGVNP
jgi:Bacterial SH3 domain